MDDKHHPTRVKLLSRASLMATTPLVTGVGIWKLMSSVRDESITCEVSSSVLTGDSSATWKVLAKICTPLSFKCTNVVTMQVIRTICNTWHGHKLYTQMSA